MDEKNPMQQVAGFMPEMQDITRQREMAKLLMQQGQAPLQGQMVGNKYVAPSPWEGIANLFSTYKANKLAKEADTKQAQLAELIRKGTAEDMLRYNELMYGAPERTVYGAGQEGPTMNLAPAIEANPRAAYEFALQSRFPQVNAYATEMQKPQKMAEGETLQRFNPVTGKMEVVGQGAPKASADIRTAAALVGLGNKDPSTWTQQDLNLVNQKVMQLNQSKTQPIMVNTGKDLSGQIGDIMKTSKADTVAAQKTLNSANKIESFANSPSFKGVGADVKLQLAQIGDALGFTGAETQQKINNTRQGVQELGRLAVMASSNKGQGAVSDYERQLYARVAGGDINLTKGELLLVANAAREGANYTIQQHQNQINYMKSNPELKPLVPFYDVPAVTATPSAPTQSGTFDFKAAAQEEARKRGLIK
jgi:hypothetical protein